MTSETGSWIVTGTGRPLAATLARGRRQSSTPCRQVKALHEERARGAGAELLRGKAREPGRRRACSPQGKRQPRAFEKRREPDLEVAGRQRPKKGR
ncbi:hypothetical protein NDU88_001220 [Pleurodeles waltl]|uniref:Uncharacterized protein n=1 Tax=Pleurodeles waltl TaxID=8319 RepID=A0AAV7LZ18_PLEWA|nr:hypothetical protein NDU88_001220 [Pleurodeles waltl]